MISELSLKDFYPEATTKPEQPETNSNLAELEKQFDATLYNYNIQPKIRNRQLREIEKQIVELLPLKVGQIFYDSWGYDQTQNDFLEIVEVSPSNKTVMVQMIGSSEIDDWTVKPNPQYRYGTPFRLHVKYFSHKPLIVGQYPYCDAKDCMTDRGCWRMGRFWPYEDKKGVYETPSYAGH